MSWRDSHLLGKSRGANPYTVQFPVGYLSHYTVPHTKDRGPGKYMPFAADLKVRCLTCTPPLLSLWLPLTRCLRMMISGSCEKGRVEHIRFQDAVPSAAPDEGVLQLERGSSVPIPQR